MFVHIYDGMSEKGFVLKKIYEFISNMIFMWYDESWLEPYNYLFCAFYV